MQDPNKLLKTAVDDIVNSINVDKLAPHAAVVKTAREMDLNVHFIKRACEVINVALTYEHFRKNAAARDVDFPIVDAQKVSAEIFPENTPTNNEKKSQWFSGSVVEEEVPNFRKAKHDVAFKEQFAKLSSAKEEARGMSDQGICEKAGWARMNMEQHLDTCRTDAVGAKLAVASQFSSLVNHWSKEAAARTSFAQFESQVFSRYGEAAVPYLDLMHKAAGGKEPRGEHDVKYIAFDDAPETLRFGDFLKAASHLVEANAELAEAASDLIEVNVKQATAYRALAEARRTPRVEEVGVPEVVVEKIAMEEEVDPVLAVAKSKLAQRQEKKAGAAGGLVSKLPGTLFDAFTDQYKKESTPSGTSFSPASNLERKLLVQNLMTTDPILKTYEPKRVVDSYEQFLRLAPELSSEKEIVRSHLRQMVASQAMTAFDGAQLMEANTKLLKQRQMDAGKPVKEER